METIYELSKKQIETHAEKILHFRLALRPSRNAMIAAPIHNCPGADSAAQRIEQILGEFRLFDAALLASVREQNKWLLFDLSGDVFDAYAETIPDKFVYGTAYIDKRMEMLMRHPDAPIPRAEPVLRAVITASFASARGRWTQNDEQTVLCMTHGLSGMERVRTEQNAARAARIILYERRNLL
jgi:hypothetical protein